MCLYIFRVLYILFGTAIHNCFLSFLTLPVSLSALCHTACICLPMWFHALESLCLYTIYILHTNTHMQIHKWDLTCTKFDLTFHKYNFTSFFTCMSYSCSRSSGSCYSDLLLTVYSPWKWQMKEVERRSHHTCNVFITQTISGESWPCYFHSSHLTTYSQIWGGRGDKLFIIFSCDSLNSVHNVGMLELRSIVTKYFIDGAQK